jgi:hypothetical protein
MATAKKIGNRGGCAEWEALESVADIKRFLRWVILSMRDTTLEPNHASIFAQIGGVMLKTIQTGDFEKRLEDIEKRLATPESHNESGSPTVTH